VGKRRGDAGRRGDRRGDRGARGLHDGTGSAGGRERRLTLAGAAPALTSELVRSSIAAVDGVANDSELADLWRDSADETEWRALLEDLKARLEAAL